MKQILKKCMALSMVWTLLFVCINCPVYASNIIQDDYSDVFEEFPEARQLYEETKFVPFEQVEKGFNFKDGLTVIYGNNIKM